MPHQLKRVLSPGTRENLDILESLTQTSDPSELENLLDNSYPEEMLLELEHTVLTIQAWSLRSIISRTPAQERSALNNSLEQTSWLCGRNCSQQRWTLIPDFQRNDMCSVLAALQDSPLSGYPHGNAFLVRRSTSTEAQIELLNCPHRMPHPDVTPIADELCLLHTDWIRGFVYGINTKIILKYTNRPVDKPNSYCQIDLSFHLADSSGSSTSVL